LTVSTRDIPILFSAPMIRALIEGRKTMTRRVVSLGNCEFGSFAPGKASKQFWQHASLDRAWPDRGFPDAAGVYRSGYLHVPCHDQAGGCAHCRQYGWAGTAHRLRPKVQIGDRMWVRETVACGACAPSPPSTWSPSFWRREQGTPDNPNGLWYAADGLAPRSPITDRGRWVPSIHMPRWASRITDVVTAVKIERLQDISDIDVIAEGVVAFQSGSTPMFGIHVEGGYEHAGLTPRETFMNLWCALHGPAAWNANPFVVATTFRVIRANIDAPEARIAA
jgi:hypothetical protein